MCSRKLTATLLGLAADFRVMHPATAQGCDRAQATDGIVYVCDGIGNAGKTVVRCATQGPLFMAKLPEGAYTMSATFRDQTQVRKFQVRANRLYVEYLRWPERPDEDYTQPRSMPD